MIPFEAANDLPEVLALRLLGGGAEESAGGLVDKADLAGFIEEEDAFAECFEDLLEEAFSRTRRERSACTSPGSIWSTRERIFSRTADFTTKELRDA